MSEKAKFIQMLDIRVGEYLWREGCFITVAFLGSLWDPNFDCIWNPLWLHLESRVIFVGDEFYMSYRNIPILDVDSCPKMEPWIMVNLRVNRCIWWSFVAKDVFRILKITGYNHGVGCYCGHLWSWFLFIFNIGGWNFRSILVYYLHVIFFGQILVMKFMPFTQDSWICKGHPPTKTHLKALKSIKLRGTSIYTLAF